MKKILYILILVASAASFTACTEQEEVTPKTEDGGTGTGTVPDPIGK